MIGVGDAVPTVTVGSPGATSLPDILGEDPAVLVFFKESCGTCQIALPVFQHWSSQVRVIGITQDDAPTTAGFLQEYGIDMDVVYDAPGFEASSAFDIDGVPATFLVENGVVTWSGSGWNVEQARELADRLAALSGSEPMLVGAEGLPPFRPG